MSAMLSARAACLAPGLCPALFFCWKQLLIHSDNTQKLQRKHAPCLQRQARDARNLQSSQLHMPTRFSKTRQAMIVHYLPMCKPKTFRQSRQHRARPCASPRHAGRSFLQSALLNPGRAANFVEATAEFPPGNEDMPCVGGPANVEGVVAAVVTIAFNRAAYLTRHLESLLEVHGRSPANQ